MSLKCDVTGSTDRVYPLPSDMQTDKVKKVCFKVAVQMEKERLAKLGVAPLEHGGAENRKAKEPAPKVKKVQEKKPVKVAPKKNAKKKKS